MRRRCPRFALLCFLSLFLFLPMPAQTNTTSLNGAVADPSGALMSGAVITALNPSMGLTQTVKTGATGEYAFDQIPPGRYTVTVGASGFSNQVRIVELLVNSPVKLSNHRLDVPFVRSRDHRLRRIIGSLRLIPAH